MNIEEIFNLHYNWADFIWVTVMLSLGYLVLLFLKRIIINIRLIWRVKSILRRVLDFILTIYEPLAAFFIISVFVMIKPGFHGLLVGLILVTTFNHIRNYVHGRLFMTDKSLKNGIRIKLENEEGIITDVGRLGIRIRSDDGLHYIPYNKLVTNGYILSSGDKVGGYYHLLILPESNQTKEQLSQFLISSPYVDGDHKPEISRTISSSGAIHVRLLVKEETHVHDLIEVLHENGYTSEITKT